MITEITTFKSQKISNVVMVIISLGTSSWDKIITLIKNGIIDIQLYLPSPKELSKEVFAAIFILFILKSVNFGYPKVITYIIKTKNERKTKQTTNYRKYFSFSWFKKNRKLPSSEK